MSDDENIEEVYGGGWNHRVVRRMCGGDASFQIHEAYYDKSGNVTAITLDAVEPYGEDAVELRRELEMMLAACDKPVLEYDEIVPPSAA